MAARAIAQCPDRLPADIDDAYDVIEDAIAAAPIFFIIEFGRRMGSAIHEKFGVDPWAGCTCTPDGAERWRRKTLEFFAWQVGGSAGTVEQLQAFYEAFKGKALENLDQMDRWMTRYPDVSERVAHRAMCLWSDIHHSQHYQSWPHYVEHAVEGGMLLLQVWLPGDGSETLPLLTYTESAPGAQVQMVPVITLNEMRLQDAEEARKQFKQHCFIDVRAPEIEVKTWDHDLYDTLIRIPYVELLAAMRSTQPSPAQGSRTSQSSATSSAGGASRAGRKHKRR